MMREGKIGIRTVQIDNNSGLLGIGRVDRLLNAKGKRVL